MSLEAEVQSLCVHIPEAIGAILCDFEGERVVSALGSAPLPPIAAAQALDHVPRNLSLSVPPAEFLLRLCGAELCGLMERFQQISTDHQLGDPYGLELSYRGVRLCAAALPEGYFLLVVMRSPAQIVRARRILKGVCAAVREDVF